jgi:hypothetical protein
VSAARGPVPPPASRAPLEAPAGLAERTLTGVAHVLRPRGRLNRCGSA